MHPPGRGLQLAAALGAAAVMATGIVAFGWPAFTVLALYWLENVIIGAFTVLRILAAGARSERYFEALGGTAFFTLHYGFFCLIHGFFVAVLFGGMNPDGGLLDPVLLMIGRVAGDRVGALVVAAMLVAAAADAWRALIASDPDDPRAIRDAMSSPYGRIVVLHLVLIGGGFTMQALHLPSLAALLLVAFKFVYDLRQIRREDAAAAGRSAAAGARR
jgi:hypothetical protein